jgi:hypothetical protein
MDRSKRHLNRYLNEVAFRWDYPKVSDRERTTQALKQTVGCRLMYHRLAKKRL